MTAFWMDEPSLSRARRAQPQVTTFEMHTTLRTYGKPPSSLFRDLPIASWIHSQHLFWRLMETLKSVIVIVAIRAG